MTIPLVFWLALISTGGYNYGTSTIVPVPFSTYQDCVNAGEAAASAGGLKYACLQQRKSDVDDWREGEKGKP